MLCSTHIPRERSNKMLVTKIANRRFCWPGLVSVLIFSALALGTTSSYSADRQKSETIEASSMGTGTQMGQMFGITVIIYEYSTPADRQVLVQAFDKGQNQG